MKFIKTTLLVLISFTLTSCLTGPEGPRGPRGYDGEVEIYSASKEIIKDDFVREDEFISVAEYSWADLDEITVDEGVVLAYLRFEGTTAWNSLPFSVPYQNDLVELRYQFDIDSFTLIVEGEVAGNNDLNEDIFVGDIFRIVAIPPSQVVAGKGLDYGNYEQVADFYGLRK